MIINTALKIRPAIPANLRSIIRAIILKAMLVAILVTGDALFGRE